MFTNGQNGINNNMSNIANNGGQIVSEDEFWKAVFGTDTAEINREAITFLGALDEIIMDRLGQNMEITTGVVIKYDEKTKKAVVNLVTSVDYVVDAIINKDGQGSLNRSYTSTQNTITVYNFSIFDELKNGDSVILVHPQEGYSSNYFIIGVLRPEMFSSLIDKVKILKEENKNRQTEIEQLRQRVTSLENQVQQLWNAVNKMSSTT